MRAARTGEEKPSRRHLASLRFHLCACTINIYVDRCRLSYCRAVAAKAISMKQSIVCTYFSMLESILIMALSLILTQTVTI